jgi:hypothetical protein
MSEGDIVGRSVFKPGLWANERSAAQRPVRPAVTMVILAPRSVFEVM